MQIRTSEGITVFVLRFTSLRGGYWAEPKDDPQSPASLRGIPHCVRNDGGVLFAGDSCFRRNDGVDVRANSCNL